MCLHFRLFIALGALLLLFSNIQPASAGHRFSENFPVSQAPGSSVFFEHLTIDGGLSQSAGLALLQDHQGFIWIGTQDGLDRYDGYNFTNFKYDPEDPNSLSYNSIIALYEDQNNNLWIGTWGGGLNRYDPKSETFTRYGVDSDNPNSISDTVIPAIVEDESGNIWIGTTGGLDLLNPGTGEITHFRSDAEDPGTLSSNAIGALFVDQQGMVWVGTGAFGIPGAGLDLIDGSSHEVQRVAPDCSQSENISAIAQDQNGFLWIGHGGYSLPGGGLTRFDPVSKNCVHFDSRSGGLYALQGANIINMYLDSDGWLWIATYEGGLYRMDVNEPGKFYSYRNIPGDSSSLSSDNVFSVILDRSGVLWVGTLNSGINKLKLHTLQFGL